MKSPKHRSRRTPLVAVGGVVLLAALIGAGALAIGALRANSSAPLSLPAPILTLYPQPTRPATPTPPAKPRAASAQAAPAPAPGSTAELRKYAIQSGDTLWDVALKFDVSLEALQAANPGLNPNLLRIGQELAIPASGAVASTVPSQPARDIQGDAEVSDQPDIQRNGGLNLRKAPGYTTEVTALLPANTPVKIIGRTNDAAWAQVKTDDGKTGWVFVAYLDLNGKFEYGKVAVTSNDQIAVPIAQPAAAGSQQPVTSKAVGPLSYPFLSVGARAKQIFSDGQKKGNRANAVSVIGDSNSDNPAFFKPFAWGAYNLGEYAYLQPTLDYFRGSFGRVSASAFGGWNTATVLDPSRAPAGCGGQTPLLCEYSQNKPSVAIILLGTGDQHAWQTFEGRYRKIIEDTIAAGVLPVLLTKMDDLECRDNNAPCGTINGVIRRLAGEYGVPLLDNRSVMDKLPGRGAISDGFHYNKPADNQSANFTAPYLQYGFNQRNLTALQTLDVIRRGVMGQ